LPVEAVTLSGFATLASRQTSQLPLAHQCSVSLPSKLDIMLGCSPGVFLERVQHVHGVCEFGDIKHPVFQRCVDPDLPDARSNSRHRLPVQWVQSLLDTPKLKAGQSSRVSRESPNVAARRAQPLQHLIRHP